MHRDHDEAEVAEEALVALTPEGCEQWRALIWRHVRAYMHGAHGIDAGKSRSSAGRRVAEGVSDRYTPAREVLVAMVECVNFHDDGNRNAAIQICEHLVQETCSIACASLSLHIVLHLCTRALGGCNQSCY